MRGLRFMVLMPIILLLAANAMAVSIGVSPGNVNFGGVLRGGYSERTVTISTNSDVPVTAHYELSGDIAEWVRFVPNSTEFSFSSKNPYKLTIIAEPAEDIRSDTYSGKVSFVTDRFGDLTGRAGGMVRAAVALNIRLGITNEEVTECRAAGFFIEDTEVGYPLRFGMTVNNDGNVRIKPEISIDIWDMMQENLVMSERVGTNEILPTTQKSIEKSIPHNLPVGQYWTSISVPECGASQFLTFSVVEKGGIADKGSFVQLNAKSWANVGEPILISALFHNQGIRPVFAQFRGDIRIDDRVITTLESDEVEVGTGEKVNLDMYFTPEDSGRYLVNGRIFYNKKITFERGTIINVNYAPETGKKNRIGTVVLLLLYIIIVITILFLVRKILKERRRKKIF